MVGPSSVHGFALESHVVLAPGVAPWPPKTQELPGGPSFLQRKKGPTLFSPHEAAHKLDEEITAKTKMTSLGHKDQVAGLRKELVEEDWMV